MPIHYTYGFKSDILDAIDVSIPQRNYFRRYSSDAIENQRTFFSELGIENCFDNRVIVANSFGTNILRVEDLSHSGYTDNECNCDGYDGVITSIPKVPLFTGFGDCPQLMVIGNNEIGLVHATRDTLDNYILQVFFDEFSRNNNLSETKIGFSPYLHTPNFGHKYLNLQRTDWDESIIEIQGVYFLDLKKMILEDLQNLGINDFNIFDLSINTYNLSQQSAERGGYQISHRQASTKEGRGGLVLMLR